MTIGPIFGAESNNPDQRSRLIKKIERTQEKLGIHFFDQIKLSTMGLKELKRLSSRLKSIHSVKQEADESKIELPIRRLLTIKDRSEFYDELMDISLQASKEQKVHPGWGPVNSGPNSPLPISQLIVTFGPGLFFIALAILALKWNRDVDDTVNKAYRWMLSPPTNQIQKPQTK